MFFYNIFLLLFKAGVRIASLFDRKAAQWVKGRKNIFARLEEAVGSQENIIWMHCASLGEFEQGRPVIEGLKERQPGYKILLTFFSPSGYEVKKDYKGADWVFYLPMDGARNAKRFLAIVKPSLVIFVKYEFWYYYLKKIKYRNIPLLLVSALFRKDMSFFKWYGSLQRKMLSRFDHLFVQNDESKRLMDEIGLGNICSVSGDTRFDRVIEISESNSPVGAIELFADTKKVIVAGSTWPGDEEVLQKVRERMDDLSLRWIIAPHEIGESHIADIEKLFPDSVRYSRMNERNVVSQVIIIDNIGLLSRLYRYAAIAWIGGGFNKGGIHNVLEAAVYGKPVLFGPKYRKYQEAVDLVRSGGAMAVNGEDDASKIISKLLTNPNDYAHRSKQSLDYVWKNKGASERILQFIQEKRLLTS